MRLIDADRLKQNWIFRGEDGKPYRDTIDEQPTIKECTGRWKTAMLDHEAFGVRPKVLYCSECNQCIAYPTRYCPNCGAMMEVEHDQRRSKASNVFCET